MLHPSLQTTFPWHIDYFIFLVFWPEPPFQLIYCWCCRCVQLWCSRDQTAHLNHIFSCLTHTGAVSHLWWDDLEHQPCLMWSLGKLHLAKSQLQYCISLYLYLLKWTIPSLPTGIWQRMLEFWIIQKQINVFPLSLLLFPVSCSMLFTSRNGVGLWRSTGRVLELISLANNAYIDLQSPRALLFLSP